MATYAIGDVHGCLDGLKHLLDLFDYQPKSDQLIFVGDLVGRGPHSYETLRFIYDLPNKHVVLGNHEIHLLCSFLTESNHKVDYHESFVRQSDAEELIEWLCQRPLCHYEESFKCLIVHAGIHPDWTLSELLIYADEYSSLLKSTDSRQTLLQHAYGNHPDIWREHLTDWNRMRVILNIFTRIRFLKADHRLDFFCKTAPKESPSDLKAWFNCKLHIPSDHCVIFGHWARLKGSISNKNIENIDGGYVHHGKMIALRLEDRQRFSLKYTS